MTDGAMSEANVDAITSVEQLVARFENSTLDYKTRYDLADKAKRGATRCEIAKDVAAFANAFGGAIVVGVVETRGQIVKLESVEDPSKLKEEVATAVQLHCVPLTPGPDEHEIWVSPKDAARLLAPGATPPLADVRLVALNVRPDPGGPIGVKQLDPAGSIYADVYRFPLRVADQTRFLDPIELPMWMNSHERRVAIHLRRAIEQASARPLRLRVFHRVGMLQHQMGFLDVKLARVDEDRMMAIFSERADASGPGPVHIPLTFIASVWQEVSDSSWNIAVNGTVFPNPNNINGNHFRFIPFLGGA